MSWLRFFPRIPGLGGVQMPKMGAGAVYGIALEMCGNAGQRAIIEDIGAQGYNDALAEALEGGDAVAVLMDMASHPDAVEEILAETGTMLNDYAEMTMEAEGLFGD